MQFGGLVPARNETADPAQQLADLAADLDAERETLERELEEIELLLQQTRTEAERHEARRVQAAERLAALDADTRSSITDLRESRDQLLTQTRRATLMEAQLEVLEGKQRALQRYQRHLEETLPRLTGLTTGHAQETGPASASGSRAILAAQEEMRREIARRMHDGPAQSIANIALQAQVLERLFQHDPGRAEAELGQLSAMVAHALEQTKNFIFDVRPMVLDDLGLVPTLRRACLELTRREQIRVVFESAGTDRRLDPELESSLFRIVDDALSGFLRSRPAGILVRLDWAADAVRATVHSQLADEEEPESAPEARRPRALDRVRGPVPPALAQMITERTDLQAKADAKHQGTFGLPPEVWAEIKSRASAVGFRVDLRDDGRLLEARVQLAEQDSG